MTDEKVPEISEKNRKQDILDAYNQVVLQLKEKRKEQMKPEQKVEEKIAQKAVKVADELSLDGISRSLNQLKTELSQSLGQILEKLESEIVQYQEVKRAVEVQQEELNEIYEIKKEATSLAAFIEVQNQQKKDFEKEMSLVRASWNREKERFELEWKEQKEAEEKRRKREQEEYDYQFKRDRQMTLDKLNDEKFKLEAEIKTKREQAEKEFSEREQSIAEREAKVEALEGRIAELETTLDQSVQAAVEENTQRLEKENEANTTFLKSEFAGERNVLQSKIQALDETVKNQSAQILQLTKQLEKASNQVQDIAVKAVESSSRARINAQMETAAFEKKQTASEPPEK